MAVTAIQNNSQNSTQAKAKTSYIGSAAIGVGVSYLLRDLIPITRQEKDEAYKADLEKIKANVKKSIIEDINEIAASKQKNEAADTFTKIYSQSDKTLEYSNVKKVFADINKLDEPLKRDVHLLVEGVKYKARLLRDEAKRVLNAGVKDLRPRSTFVGLGVLSGLFIAFISNILKTPSTSENN